jgi:hypothetical protein
MFWFFKMAAKFKMAVIVKNSFLGRFEQKKNPFWTCHTQLFYVIDKQIKDKTEKSQNREFLGTIFFYF